MLQYVFGLRCGWSSGADLGFIGFGFGLAPGALMMLCGFGFLGGLVCLCRFVFLVWWLWLIGLDVVVGFSLCVGFLGICIADLVSLLSVEGCYNGWILGLVIVCFWAVVLLCGCVCISVFCGFADLLDLLILFRFCLVILGFRVCVGFGFYCWLVGVGFDVVSGFVC